MLKVDITMTACLRPELLSITLYSFWQQLFSSYPEIDYRLIINVDPAGGNIGQLAEMKRICAKYFEDAIINTPPSANFAKAFKWTWDQVRDDAHFVFHLEDDWQLLQSVNLLEMIAFFVKYPDLIILRLNAFKSGEVQTKNWDLLIPWNGEFYEISQENKGTIGFCGHPSLIDAGFVRFAREHLSGISNPEKELKGHHKILGQIFQSSQIGVYGKPNTPPYIKDIGRDWMVRNGLRKKGNKAFFTEWEGY